MKDENPWISVDDQMPPTGEWVLVWNKSRQGVPGIDAFYPQGWCSASKSITYWQHIVGPKNQTSQKNDSLPINLDWFIKLIENICGNFSKEILELERKYHAEKEPTSPMMVEAPREDNTFYSSWDPFQSPDIKEKIWWNNTADHRLWYWHNGKWNRAL